MKAKPISLTIYDSLPPIVQTAIDSGDHLLALSKCLKHQIRAPDELLALAGEQASKGAPAGMKVTFERYLNRVRAVCAK